MIGFGGEFMLFKLLFFLVFFAILGVFIATAVKGISQWNKNNHSPRLTVPATIVSKRTNVARYGNAGNIHHHSHTSTTYYVTFQFESGDRLELYVEGPEYGLLAEGDRGSLSFQGTRYLGFQRM